jgi:hypothetical protein
MPKTQDRLGHRGIIAERPIGRTLPLDLEERAIRQGWAIPEYKRQEIIEQALTLALAGESQRIKVQALRVLVMMDALNVRRERNDQDADRDDTRAKIDSLRAYLDSPAGRAALNQLSDASLSALNPPATPPSTPPAPPTPRAPDTQSEGEGDLPPSA